MGVPVNPHPQAHLPAPCLYKIKMRGSSKIAWIVAIRTTCYSLILMLFWNVFFFLVKQGVPSDEELEWLSHQLENWEELGRRLEIEEATLTAFDDDYRKKRQKIYKMLRHWKKKDGSDATYTVLDDALCYQFVNRTDLAEKLCRQQHEWLFTLLTPRQLLFLFLLFIPLSNEQVSPVWVHYYHLKYQISYLPLLHGIVFLTCELRACARAGCRYEVGNGTRSIGRFL